MIDVCCFGVSITNCFYNIYQTESAWEVFSEHILQSRQGDRGLKENCEVSVKLYYK